MRIFTNPNFDFIRWRWHAIALSLVVVIAGAATILTRGMPLGIDFSGGTLVIVRFEGPTSEDDVRTALETLPGEKVVQRYGDDPAANEFLVRLPQTSDAEEGFNLEAGSRAVTEALDKAGLPKYEVLGREFVGPTIGADLQRKGIYATLLSILGITVYIGLRFRFSFAAGAIAATLHDVFVVFAFLAFFGYELSLNVVAAILTITGYSVNDTIVIFDRVRENSRLLRRDPLDKVVNLAVNQTLGRTVITAGTTFFSVLALYLFGGEVLEGFAFAMLVGIVSGTYSTVFIAAAIAILLSGRKTAAGRAAVPVEEAVAERPRKGGRNVRVS
jgi:preprotein translocase subunit SecF